MDYLETLFKSTFADYKIIFDDYLKLLYKEVPEVAQSLKSLKLDLNLPGVDPDKRGDRFVLQHMIDQMEEKEDLKMKISLKQDLGLPVEINEMLARPTRDKQLVKDLKEDLAQNGLLDQFLEYRRDRNIRTHKWLITILNMNTPLNYTYPYKKQGDTLWLSWSIIIFSYLSDFELFYKYIIDPITGLSYKDASYADRLGIFCDSNTVFLNKLFENTLKPYVRSNIAHQKYYVDTKEELIYFLEDPENENDERKISFGKMIQLASNMNLLLWSGITLVYSLGNGGNLGDNPFLLDQNEIEMVKNAPFYSDMMQIDLLTTNFMNVQKKVLDLKNKYPAITSYPYAFDQSKILFRLLFMRKYPQWIQLIYLGMFNDYLVGYTLLKDRFLMPLAKVLDQNITQYTSDLNLLERIAEYKDGKYSSLFDNIDPESRNAIAHLDFFLRDNSFVFYRSSSDNIERLRFDGMELFFLFNRCELVFDDVRRNIGKYIGIAQLLSYLYFDPYKEETEFEKVLATIGIRLKNALPILERDNTRSGTLLFHALLLLRAILFAEHDERKKLLRRIKSFGKRNPEYIEKIYALTILATFRIKYQSSKVLLKLFNYFNLIPNTIEGKIRLLEFKAVVFHVNGKTIKAENAISQATELRKNSNI